MKYFLYALLAGFCFAVLFCIWQGFRYERLRSRETRNKKQRVYYDKMGMSYFVISIFPLGIAIAGFIVLRQPGKLWIYYLAGWFRYASITTVCTALVYMAISEIVIAFIDIGWTIRRIFIRERSSNRKKKSTKK